MRVVWRLFSAANRLHIYATGSFHQVVGDKVGVDKATVCRIARKFGCFA